MSGMRRVLPLLAVMVLFAPWAFAADKAEETRINISKLQESIREHEDKLADTAGRERTLFEELQRLDSALDEQRSRM